MKKADKIREFLLFAKIPDKEVARITGVNRMTIGNIKL